MTSTEMDRLTPENIDAQFCSDWLKDEIRNLFKQRDDWRGTAQHARTEWGIEVHNLKAYIAEQARKLDDLGTEYAIVCHFKQVAAEAEANLAKAAGENKKLLSDYANHTDTLARAWDAEAKLDKAVEALKYYSNEDNWHEDTLVVGKAWSNRQKKHIGFVDATTAPWQRARQALKELGVG